MAARMCAYAELDAMTGALLGLVDDPQQECGEVADFEFTLRLINGQGRPVGELTVYLCRSCEDHAAESHTAEHVKSVRLRSKLPAKT